MAEKDIAIDSQTWKVWMSTNPTKPCATLHSLYDLIADGEGLYSRQKPETQKFKGANLGHDIIIYKNDLYYTSGLVNVSKQFSLWELYGIDLHCPNYDKRNKPLVYSMKGSKFENILTNEIYIYDKSAALLPNSIQSFHNDDNVTGLGIGVWDKGGKDGWQSYNNLFSVGSQDRSASVTSADIVLVNKDTVFQSSMIFENGKDAFTALYLNSTNKIVEFVKRCLSKHIPNSLEQVEKLHKKDKNNSVFLTDLISDEKMKYLLQHIYVWVKAPFAADYIKPQDFDQNLNKDSNVIHKNLYSRVTNGDYNRYDQTVERYEELHTKAYVPKNTPLKDYISKKFYSEQPDVEQTMKKIIDDSDLPESDIGSVLTEPVKDGTAITTLTPPQFFDPESRREPKTYNRVPTIIPKNGNIVADSRIMSPTIDELWYIIKKMIAGRPADTIKIINEDFSKSFASDQITKSGYDTRGEQSQANSVNNKDTTLTEVLNPFIFEYENGLKVGDPVDFEISPSYTKNDEEYELNNNSGIKITEFFSQPNKTIYVDFSDVIKDTETLQKWVESNNYIPIKKVSIGGINLDTFIGEETDWEPRQAPLSLRELESRILGNKYSIIKNYRYITTNFSVVGPLGYHYDDNKKILAAGSLYQFHRDYNFKHDNPNTFFRLNGEGEELYDSTNSINQKSGLDIEASDLKSPDAIPENGLLLYNSKEKKMSKFPLLVDNYGKSEYIENEYGNYTGADVFLSAIGDWRIKTEHTRFPILRSRY